MKPVKETAMYQPISKKETGNCGVLKDKLRKGWGGEREREIDWI